MSTAYDDLRARLRRAATLTSIEALLGWDQETMMPADGGPFRAEQLSLIVRLRHETFTDPQVGEWIAASEADSAVMDDPAEAANLAEIRRDYDRACKLPNDLVASLSETSSRAMEAWKRARASDDFGAFRPWLEQLLELWRAKAQAYGVPDGGEAYDALIEDYEPDTRSVDLDRLFAPLRRETVRLLEAVLENGGQPDHSIDGVELSITDQKRFHRHMLESIGFKMTGGRLDTSAHPFSSGIGPGDTRVTTRFRADQFADALSSTLHEAGHALYEQGIPRETRFGEPLAQSVSLGMHESQSRLWENHVGRARSFWNWAAPEAQRFFAPMLDRFDADGFYRSINVVQPRAIRVESDELTYNLHIMLRFDLERAMLRGDLAVADLPDAWRDRMRDDLGLEGIDDAHGCLQDIHWSMGAIGYFPTYTLGNLYAAQFWSALMDDCPDVDAAMAGGSFEPVLGWLREQIHRHGRRYSADELCRRITGRALDHHALVRHLETKLGDVYGVECVENR